MKLLLNIFLNKNKKVMKEQVNLFSQIKEDNLRHSTERVYEFLSNLPNFKNRFRYCCYLNYQIHENKKFIYKTIIFANNKSFHWKFIKEYLNSNCLYENKIQKDILNIEKEKIIPYISFTPIDATKVKKIIRKLKSFEVVNIDKIFNDMSVKSNIFNILMIKIKEEEFNKNVLNNLQKNNILNFNCKYIIFKNSYSDILYIVTHKNNYKALREAMPNVKISKNVVMPLFNSYELVE